MKESFVVGEIIRYRKDIREITPGGEFTHIYRKGKIISITQEGKYNIKPMFENENLICTSHIVFNVEEERITKINNPKLNDLLYYTMQ